MRFLRRAPVEQSRRRRLREMLLLALRVAALLLLAFAFARPYLTESAAALAAPATIVLVDTSVSMSAPGQFERARARAARDRSRCAPGSSVASWRSPTAPTSLRRCRDDRAGALTALSQLKAGRGRHALSHGARPRRRSARRTLRPHRRRHRPAAERLGRGRPGRRVPNGIAGRGRGHRRAGRQHRGDGAARRGDRGDGVRAELLDASGDRAGDLRDRRPAGSAPCRSRSLPGGNGEARLALHGAASGALVRGDRRPRGICGRQRAVCAARRGGSAARARGDRVGPSVRIVLPRARARRSRKAPAGSGSARSAAPRSRR